MNNTINITSEGLLHNTHVFVNGGELRVSSIDIHVDGQNDIVTATLKVTMPSFDVSILESKTRLIIEDYRNESDSNRD